MLLMRVGRLIIRAQTLGAAEEAEVFAFARDRDPRVRQLALNAAGLALRRGSSSVLEAAVIAGLYDPAEDVLLRALASLREAGLTLQSFDAGIIQRLDALFSDFGRRVRVETVETAKAMLQRGSLGPELDPARLLVLPVCPAPNREIQSTKRRPRLVAALLIEF